MGGAGALPALRGVTFVFFLTRFLTMAPHTGSYFLYSASSVPSRTLTLPQADSLRKQEK